MIICVRFTNLIKSFLWGFFDNLSKTLDLCLIGEIKSQIYLDV